MERDELLVPFERMLSQVFPPEVVRRIEQGETWQAQWDELESSGYLDALVLLARLHARRNYRPVADTLTELLNATRAHVGFVLRPAGEQALANVLHIAELARQYEANGGMSFRGFVEELRDQAEGGQAAIVTIIEVGA